MTPWDLPLNRMRHSPLKGLFGGGAKAPNPPKAPPPMPVPDDDLIKQAELRKIQLAQSTGRASTILTDGSADKLGG